MKQTRLIMGMPITVDILNISNFEPLFDEVFNYFKYVDHKFSTYKQNSEISQINQGKILPSDYSYDMKLIFELSELTRQQTNGCFDIRNKDIIDPSGIVKGWAIYNASRILLRNNVCDFYIEAGGDIQVSGKNKLGKLWQVGIKNPFDKKNIIKVLALEDQGVATSGTYIRGQHIYNPKNKNKLITDFVSFTVIGPNVYEADRFATAALAMGLNGIYFIENLSGFEAYAVDQHGVAIFTSGFNHYVV